MDVGFELRQTRERRGMSLQQLSRITKINLRVLDAIEAQDADRLPVAVFTRSFVRTYAAEIGLDPDDTWRRYAEQFDTADPALPLAAEVEPDMAAEPFPVSRGARVLQGRFGTTAVLVLVGLTAYVLARKDATEGTPQPASAAVTVSAASLAQPPQTEAQPVGTSGTALTPLDALRVTFAPTGPCWVGATVNGERVLGTLLNPGEQRSVDAQADVTLRVGDPSTCAFSINGKPAKVPGAAGQAVTVLLTRENAARFVVN